MNPIANIGSQLISGAWSAYPSSYVKTWENVFLRGNNAPGTVVCQIWQANASLALVHRVYPLANSVWNGSYVTIAALGLLSAATSRIENRYIKYTIHQVQGNVGNLCQLINFVSAAGLICFGQPFFGLASLSLTTFGCLERMDYKIPEGIGRKVNQSAYFFTILARLFLGDWKTRLYTGVVTSAYMGVCMGLKSFIESFKDQNMPPPSERMKVNRKIQEMLGISAYKINPAHIEREVYRIPPLTQPVDFNQLNLAFKQIDWSNQENIQAATAILTQDDNWNRGKALPGESMQSYLERGMEDLVSKALAKNSLEMVSEEFSKNPLKDVLGHFLLRGNFAPPLLMTIAASGHACEVANYDTALRLYLLLTNRSLSLPQKVLYILAQNRKDLFDTYIMCDFRKIIEKINGEDLHFRNFFVSLLGGDVGHPDFQQAVMDEVILKIPNIGVINRSVFEDGYSQVFKQYNPLITIQRAFDGVLQPDGSRAQRKIFIDDLEAWGHAKLYTLEQMMNEDGTIKKEILFEILAEATVLEPITTSQILDRMPIGEEYIQSHYIPFMEKLRQSPEDLQAVLEQPKIDKFIYYMVRACRSLDQHQEMFQILKAQNKLELMRKFFHSSVMTQEFQKLEKYFDEFSQEEIEALFLSNDEFRNLHPKILFALWDWNKGALQHKIKGLLPTYFPVFMPIDFKEKDYLDLACFISPIYAKFLVRCHLKDHSDEFKRQVLMLSVSPEKLLDDFREGGLE